jgi:4-amino-4-deoxy-L-arabinose transferase-like glycosyltransferase
MRDPERRPHDSLLILVLAIGVVALRLAFSPLAPLLDPDEGRNAEIGREMAVSGDLVIPQLAGMPALDKPPGLFLMEAALIRVLGPTPLAARLPAALCAIGLLLVVGRQALREGGSRFALTTVALIATAPLFLILVAFVIFDMPLALCVTVVWVSLARELEEGPAPARRLAMFAAVAAGILIKGPVMLAWAIGGSLAVAALLRSRDALRWLAWWPGWLVVLATAGGWFALACVRHPEYPNYAFIQESLGRLTSNQFHRDQPLWFVPATLAVGALPWSLATPWRRPVTRSERVALGFLLFAVVFFSVSRSKLVTYLLPAIPMMVWLAARAWTDPDRVRQAAWRVAAVYAVLAIALGVAAWVWLRDHAGPEPAMGVAVTFAIAAAAIAVAVLVARRAALTFGAVVALGPLILGPLATMALHWGIAGESGEPLAVAIAREAGPHARVRYEYCYSPGTDYRLNRTGLLVSEVGHETASNYQFRYRDTLMKRGLWTAPATPLEAGDADVVVRVAGRKQAPVPPGWFYRDDRFIAYKAEQQR